MAVLATPTPGSLPNPAHWPQWPLVCARMKSHQRDQWCKTRLLDPQAKMPFAFNYGDQPAEQLLAQWPRKLESKQLDAARTQHTLTWADPKTGLEVRCVAVEYADYPALEWTVYFRNAGQANTPILKDIQGLDARFERSADGEFVLHGNKGDWCAPDSFQPFQDVLGPRRANGSCPKADDRPITPGRISICRCPEAGCFWPSGGPANGPDRSSATRAAACASSPARN